MKRASDVNATASFVTCTVRMDLIKILKSERSRCTGHVTRIWEIKNARRNFVVKIVGERLLGRLEMDVGI
jgi:hypothetical protein